MRPEPKLSEQQVKAMRMLRATAQSSWADLGEQFGVHAKTAYRVCTGRSRKTIGGPCEAANETANACASRPVRCPECGARLIKLPCKLCQDGWARIVIRLLIEAGLYDPERDKAALRD